MIQIDSKSSVSPEQLSEQQFQEFKAAFHEELVEALDLTAVTTLEHDGVRDEIRQAAAHICRERTSSWDQEFQDRMLDELMDEIFGLGPIESFMRDPDVSDILVNHAGEVYIERHGCLERTETVFADDRHVLRVIQRAVSRVGRRIDEVNPMVDARLPDGSRLNAIIPPLAIKGPSLSIRRFAAKPFDLDALTANRTMISDMVTFLSSAIQARVSLLVSGGTGAGKTTMLNALSSAIPQGERLITIEDSVELQLQHPHVIQLETRDANTEGRGEVDQRQLVRNSLRMRPDRILVGEVRGAEALDMLQAMNTGHEGSLTTIHANDERDALSRLEMMVAMTGYELPVHVVRKYIASGIRLVVHVARLKGGTRRLMGISEITGFRDGDLHLEEIFGFQQTGIDKKGGATGEFYVTGHRPTFLDRLSAFGAEVPDALFTPRRIDCQSTLGADSGE